MTQGIVITAFAYSQRFQTKIQGLPPDVQQAAKEALDLLIKNPRAKSLRLHNLTGLPKPTMWKVDVYANHSWQITFEINGSVAELKRIGRHKSIDRDPR